MEASPNLSICESFCTRLKTFLWWRILYLHNVPTLSSIACTVEATAGREGNCSEARAIVVDGLLPVYWGLRCGHCPVYGPTRWCTLYSVHSMQSIAPPPSSSSETTYSTEMHFPRTETGNKTSLKTLSRGGRCTETKEEGAVLHSRALQPSATKPQIAPTWNCKTGQASRVTKGKVRVQFKSVQTLLNCPPKNRAALKPNRNGFTSVSERDNSETTRAKVPLTLACLVGPKWPKFSQRGNTTTVDINKKSLGSFWKQMFMVMV